MIDQDYSFIRLRDSFNDAKNLGYSPNVKIIYNGQVHLRTDESYLITTNTPNGISFQADYSVFVVDCFNTVLKDITNNVFVDEFTDYKGIQQISFEIVNIGFDFGLDNVYLRFESNSNSNYVYWSNPIFISNFDAEFTSLLTYRHKSIWYGIDFQTVDFYNKIRIRIFKKQERDTINIGKYTETNGRTRGTRAIITPFTEYNAENMDDWTLKRLNVALTSTDCYINCVKVNYSDPLEFSDIIEASNIINTSILVNHDLNDSLDVGYQIYEGIQIISLIPSDGFSIGNLPMGICAFNQNITINIGSLRLYNSSNLLLKTFTQTDLINNGNSFEINDNLNTYCFLEDNYYFLMDSGLISSTAGEVFQGITNINTWAFSIADGEYEYTEYDDTEYVTNLPTPVVNDIFNDTFNDIFG